MSALQCGMAMTAVKVQCSWYSAQQRKCIVLVLSWPARLQRQSLKGCITYIFYLCRKAKAVELMLVDALLAADPVLKMTERIHDPREFIKMDDTLLKQVENYSMLHPHWERSEDFGPISEAQKIITRYGSSVCCPHVRYSRHIFSLHNVDIQQTHCLPLWSQSNASMGYVFGNSEDYCQAHISSYRPTKP